MVLVKALLSKKKLVSLWWLVCVCESARHLTRLATFGWKVTTLQSSFRHPPRQRPTTTSQPLDTHRAASTGKSMKRSYSQLSARYVDRECVVCSNTDLKTLKEHLKSRHEELKVFEAARRGFPRRRCGSRTPCRLGAARHGGVRRAHEGRRNANLSLRAPRTARPPSCF